MVKKQNSMENPDSQIMDTIPLEQDLQDLFQQSYNYDQRTYTGEKPKNKLNGAVEKFEKNLEDAGDREEERLHKISDKRNFTRLSKMDPASMEWDDLEMWNSLKTEYPNMSLKKMNKSNDDESMTSDSLPKQMEHVLGDIDDLSRMCSEQNRDNAVAKLDEIKKLCIELFRRLETMTDNAPDGHLPDDIESVIKKTLKKYDSSKVKKLCKCSGDKCEIQIADKLDNINVPQGSLIVLKSDNTWNIRS